MAHISVLDTTFIMQLVNEVFLLSADGHMIMDDMCSFMQTC
jgi:hypothetical protein